MHASGLAAAHGARAALRPRRYGHAIVDCPTFALDRFRTHSQAFLELPREQRVEAACKGCGAHLGHVMRDAGSATGERFCINSAALRFIHFEASKVKHA